MTDVNNLIKGLVRPEIQALKSYHVPDSSGLLKLDAMENPHAWPGDKLNDAWRETLRAVEANRYPDPGAEKVREGLSELLELSSLEKEYGVELDILLGNGSDELIQMLAMALAQNGRGVMAPEPSFVMYSMIAKFIGMPYRGVTLNADFSLDVDTFIAQMQADDPALVFLAVPNNPTGNVFDAEEIERIIEACSGLVVIDEAYLAFTESDLLYLCAKYANVVVMRTLSKVGLAGLRLGFMIGQKAWIEEFDKVRLPYNINVLTQASAVFALENYATLLGQTQGLCEARSELTAALNALPLEVFESEANFVLVRCQDAAAREVFEQMKADGVLIKCLDGAHPSLSNCLRLTVGTPDQNQQMLAALKKALNS